MERSMHVYTLTESNREWDFHREVRYYASKRKAQAKAIELAAKQSKAEEEGLDCQSLRVRRARLRPSL